MAADFADVIGPQTVVNGRIEGTAPVLVRGRVTGEIALEDHLLVAEGGTVDAEIDVQNLTVEGHLAGTATVRERAVVKEGGLVTGTLKTPIIVIDDGARLTARVEMQVDLPEGVADPNNPRKTGR